MTTRHPHFEKLRSTFIWLPAYICQRCVRRPPNARPVHLIIALANHFEPGFQPEAPGKLADRNERERRMENWCRKYPGAVDGWRDDDGQCFRHTYFYPAEEYDETLIDRLAEHCHGGWGEIEVQLHHGVHVPDTTDSTSRILREFRDALAAHGCLCRENGSGPPRYAFVHGNWALANSAQGRFCGVDSEMQILADTGCYADFTLPSAPSMAQVGKINALYECEGPLERAAPHRRGHDLRCGRPPKVFPLIVQGPLMLNLGRQKHGWPFPGVENGELSSANPPTTDRLRLWKQAAIAIRGRPEWLFIKLHCHGMDPRDVGAMLGRPLQQFLGELVAAPRKGDYLLHFVTAREMVNIILAACDGRDGNPGQYREYRFQLIQCGGPGKTCSEVSG